jgi:hypothetical protein
MIGIRNFEAAVPDDLVPQIRVEYTGGEQDTRIPFRSLQLYESLLPVAARRIAVVYNDAKRRSDFHGSIGTDNNFLLLANGPSPL